MNRPDDASFDVVLVGAGIMSATTATLLQLLAPQLRIAVVERLQDCAQESSMAWNNAGTGHAANCELNYTPQRDDGSVDIDEALKVNTEFDVSRELWAHLVRIGTITDPRSFLHPCPHISFVTEQENVAFLRARFEAMQRHHCYRGMEYSEDSAVIAQWAPLVMEGRDPGQAVAATRMVSGTDVDYGALTHQLMTGLQQRGAEVRYDTEVADLTRTDDGWQLTTRDGAGHDDAIRARFVFLGAGGASLKLLQKSNIPEGRGYAGFPVSGVWLRCDLPELAARHAAKVYSKAASGSPPMSVPHLDLRVVDGKASLLFGPYAGVSTRLLKHGSALDLFDTLSADNLLPMLDVAGHNLRLEEYLLGQVLQSHHAQFKVLQQLFPQARPEDWRLEVAGQRVQIIKPNATGYGGALRFGTELVAAEDRSVVALLGASPGASTAAAIAVEVLQTCFTEQLTEQAWLPHLRAILPSYGIDLREDAQACRASRSGTAAVLGIREPND
ncbi:malate dehydrogenase (quinone) [Stenotrophomonas sp.]|uniref:malate dehydrogenase (quinone) n=1 Tax=Stenotrophomonas sp. TaxID=69392 RepID=UPI0028A12CD9|nr:malate dehydrogenase (quinone) [Stenotrophomonas sp.]